ncbi:uncharacterized protein FA14DRAFT_74540 [Meira miltonrushii]|uniref:Uncharacterized protein n=1 Tax=Meira miltonrushii TaxID=1280837 RepID=A0A316V4I3_9BASI|nr:uncharacterized protein FA14DRAFT_74540 [Meira miltonrushii]PWN32469.1 hypothetical protein FA14DRAFT_74540 [Meira miltonrushii]
MDVAQASPGGLFDPATLAGAVTNAVVATQAAAAALPTIVAAPTTAAAETPNDGLVTPTSQALPESSISDTPASTTPDEASSSSPISSSASMSSKSSASLSSTASSTNTADAKNNNNGNGGYKFHIAWLIPVFVILGLLLMLAVGGKIWGRVSFAKERAVKRQQRLLAQRKASMIQQQSQRNSQVESDYNEQGEWQEKGWGQYNHPPNPDESLEMQRKYAEFDAIEEEEEDEYRKSSSSQDHRQQEGVELYDGPVHMPYDDGSETESEHELKGPLSALGGHLAGQRNGRALPPPARMEMERYGNMVKANSWWSVQWNRHFGAGEDDNGRYAGVVDEEKRRKSRDTASAWLAGQRSALGSTDNLAEATPQQQLTGNAWSRFKQSIGWGFDGSSPALDMDRRNRAHALVLTPQPPTLWSRIPLEDDDNYTGDFARRQSVASRSHAPVELFDAPVNLERQQSFGRPVISSMALDRSLPPTPFSPIGTPAPANALMGPSGKKREGSLKRARTMEANTSTPNSQISSRSHTMKEPKRSALSRSNTSNQAKRSKSLRFSEDVPAKQPAAESDEEDDENNLRRYKSMSSVAASAANAAREKDSKAGARKEGMSRQKTFAGQSPKTKRKPAPITPDAEVDTGKSTFTALKPVREVQKRPVNFGSDEENDSKVSKPDGSSQIPSVDSFVLARSRTKKQKQLDRINSLSEKDLNAMDVDEEARMKIDSLKEQITEQEDLNRSPDLQAVDDLATEIDSVLLSVIARSNTSKSYARSVGGFASAAPTPHMKATEENETPSKFNKSPALPPATPTTPMTPRTMARTGTWHKKNGRWVRTSPTTGKEQITSLQNTPIAAMGKTVVPTSPFTPTGKTGTMKLPTSLPKALLSGSPERKIIPLPLGDKEDRYTPHGAGSVISSHSASGRSNVSETSNKSSKASFANQYAIGDSRGNLRPESGSGLMTNRRSVHSQISEHDLFFTSRQAPSSTGSESPTKSHSLRSDHSSTVASVDDDTEPETREKTGFSPKRRAALAKRKESPRRYTAKLSTGEETEDEDDENFDASDIIDAYNALKTPKSENGDSIFDGDEILSPEQINANAQQQQQQQYRLHTGKSLRTPAEKKRERQYAMDRVQSIVTRAHAARLQKTPPELWMDN